MFTTKCNNSFCASLDPKTKEEMCKHGFRFILKERREYVFDFYDNQIYLINSGKLLTVRQRENGKQKGVELVKPGYLLGVSSLFNTKSVSIIIFPLTKVTGCAFSKEYFENLCSKDINIAFQVIKFMSARFDYLIENLEHLALDNSEEIIKWVLDKNYKELTHEEVALLTGLHRVTVSKTLSRLLKK